MAASDEVNLIDSKVSIVASGFNFVLKVSKSSENKWVSFYFRLKLGS